MKRFALLLAALIAAFALGGVNHPSQTVADSVAVARTEPAPAPAPAPTPAPAVDPVIILPPDGPIVPPTPPPTPGPHQPTKLGKGVLYAISFPSPLDISDVPEGLITIAAPKTPLTVFGSFADPKPGDANGRTFSDGYVYLIQAAGVGEVKLVVSAGPGKAKVRRCLMVNDGSVPVPPTPPGPGPNPPGPTPPLPPDPFTSAGDVAPGGLRAIIVFSEADISKLTGGQKSAIYGATVRTYLNTHTVLGADGKTHAWRIWPDSTDPTNDDAVFAKAFKRPHASLPWLILGNGVTGFEGALPDHIEDTTALLKKYGGD